MLSYTVHFFNVNDLVLIRVVGIDGTLILAKGNIPVDRGKVLLLSQFLVQSPKDLTSKISIALEDLIQTCTILNVEAVTGSAKSPPGGDTAPTTVTLPEIQSMLNLFHRSRNPKYVTKSVSSKT
jgi:hypothetical protein